MMATYTMISSSYHNQMMKKMKFPKSASHKVVRLQSSSSSSSVLPENPNLKKKKRGPPSPQPVCEDQREMKKMKMKFVNSSTAASTPPLSPITLHTAMVKSRFAETIFKVQKQRLEKISSDPVKLEKELAEMKRKHRDEKERIEAQLREAQRMADLEAKQKQEDSEKERKLKQAQLQRQRKRERLALEKMEAVALCELQQPYCCTLKELGILTRCDRACSWGCWGPHHTSPLEQLGLHIKEDDEEYYDQVELEEGEIV